MKIAILTGGTSSEREIALKSAETVEHVLQDRHVCTVFDLPADLDRFFASRVSFDVAIPVFHGKGGEDGVIQGFLKTLGIPFLFSDVEAHAIGMDKARAKILVAHAGVQTPSSRELQADERVTYVRPVVVKPADAGSSVGVTIAKNQEELDRGCASARAASEHVLLEDFVEGDEFTVAVVDDKAEKPKPLLVTQIKSKNAFFDLESKYDPALFEELCPAPISEELAKRLQNAGLLAHLAIGARHVSRSDFIVDANGGIWFLEINTIPGMTSVSLLPKIIEASGRDFGDQLCAWIDSVAQS